MALTPNIPQTPTKSEILVHHAHTVKSFILGFAMPQDRTLSWEARGLLTYLLSKPQDWVLQPKDLEQKCGRDKVYSILKELIDAHYIHRTDPLRDEKTQQVTGVIYTIYEVPYELEPYTDSPYAVLPYTANTYITTERENNRENIASTSDAAPKSDIAITGAVTGSDSKHAVSESGSGTNQKPPVPKTPLKDKKPELTAEELADKRAYDERMTGVFYAVAFEMFGIVKGTSMGANEVKRIKSIRTELDTIDGTVTGDSVRDFVTWYKATYPDISTPRDAGKVADHYRKFKATKTTANFSKPTLVQHPDIPGVWITPGQLRGIMVEREYQKRMVKDEQR